MALRLANVAKELELPDVQAPGSRVRSGKSGIKKGRLVETSLQFSVKKFVTNNDRRIVTGEVYSPFVIDTHDEMMLPDDVEIMAHRFLADNRNQYIDVMHDNKLVRATIIESYIAKVNDPDGYSEGAWVASIYVDDEDLWQRIRAGELNGFSIEAWVFKVDAEIEYDYLPMHYGFTEENAGHDHAFYVEVDEIGRVTRGFTSVDDGHFHEILAGTATELSNDPQGIRHAHRYFLQEIE